MLMRYAIGLDIGGTKIAAGIVNENGDLIQKEVMASDPSDRERMFSQVETCIKQLLDHCSIPEVEMIGIGAGVPGKVDRDEGIAVFQNNLPWSQFPLLERIKQAFGTEQIVIDNDVYMAAFAEWKKANLQADDLLAYITISTGISCALIQGGEFIRGAGFAGEIGLVPVEAPGASKKIERLEWTASGPAVEKRAIEVLGRETVTAKEIFSAFHTDDADKKRIIDEMVASMGHGVYMLISLLDPHQIVFGGSVATNNPYLLHLFKQKLADYLIDEQQHILQGMKISNLSGDAGIIGTGLRVFAEKDKHVSV